MLVKVSERACEGFTPYKGDVDKVEPFEARSHIVGNDAFGHAFCKNWKRPPAK